MDKGKEEKIEVVICFHCGNKTSHKQLHIHTQKVPLGIHEPTDYKELEADNYILFFECSTCKGITVKSLFSEEIDDPNEVDMDRVTTLYPNQKEFPKSMPDTIVKTYREALRVKKISPISFSLLIRKALEALCEDQKAEGKNLNEKVKFIVKTMKLPEKFAEMIDSIRVLGNMGAHKIDFAITPRQTDSLDYFFIAIVEYVYIAPQKIAEIQTSLKS